MSEQQWQVEMLWRCTSCAEKNLGRYTACQRCGQPKTGREEYEMPADTSSAAAIHDAGLLRMANAGANWRCKFCGSDQRRYDDSCAHCGADQSQGQDLGAIPEPPAVGQGRGFGQDAVASPGPAPRRPASKGPLVVVLVVMGGAVGLLLLAGLVSFRRSRSVVRPVYQPAAVVAAAPTYRDMAARLTGVGWVHSVNVQRYKILSAEGFSESRPADAFDVKKTGQRAHHTDRVPDGTTTETYTETVPDGSTTESYTVQESCGQTCTTTPQSCSNKCTSGKNGFANCKQVCTGGGRSCTTKYCSRTKTRQVPKTKTVTRTRQVPKFKDVTRFQDTFSWKYWGWSEERSVKATGTTAETRWPSDAEVALNKAVGKGEKERESRAGSYTLHFACDDGGTYDVSSPDLDSFRRTAAATAFTLRVDGGRATLLDAPSAPAASASP